MQPKLTALTPLFTKKRCVKPGNKSLAILLLSTSKLWVAPLLPTQGCLLWILFDIHYRSSCPGQQRSIALPTEHSSGGTCSLFQTAPLASSSSSSERLPCWAPLPGNACWLPQSLGALWWGGTKWGAMVGQWRWCQSRDKKCARPRSCHGLWVGSLWRVPRAQLSQPHFI